MRASTIIRRLLGPFLPDVHAARLHAVFVVVDALLHGGRLSLTALGRAVRGQVAAKHNIKRVDRLLGNRLLHDELPEFYGALARAVVPPHSRPVILVDWSKLGDGQWALVAAVPFNGRSVPVYSEVHPEPSLGADAVHRAFLMTLRQRVVPRTCTPIIVTDAGFQNPWFKAVAALGWDFIGRLNAGVLTCEGGTSPTLRKRRDAWTFGSDLMKTATSRPTDLGFMWVAKSKPLAMRLVLARRPPRGRKGAAKVSRAGIHPGSRAWKQARAQAKAPWLIGTSLAALGAARVIDIYAQRMQIEEHFRDTKNARHGWSFEFASSRSLARLETLLLIGAIATLALLLVGLAAEQQGLHRDYQANTLRDRRVLSLFKLGMLILAPATRPRDRPVVHQSLVSAVHRAVRDTLGPTLAQAVPT